MKKIKLFAAGAFLLASCLAAGAAENKKKPNVFNNGTETVYYPAGWKHSVSQAVFGVVDLYSGYLRRDPARPMGAKNWVNVLIRKIDPSGWNFKRKPTMTDYVNDKRCDVPKCSKWTWRECKEHEAARELPTKVLKSCVPTSYPRLVEGVCGKYYERKTIGDGYLYFFRDETVNSSLSDPGDDLMEITAYFAKGGNTYYAELICPTGEYETYKAQFIWILTNLKVIPAGSR